MSSPRAADRPWLLGPAPDLLLGCGLGYALLVAALAALGVRMDVVSGWLPFVVLCTGIPHYGATLLRVYATAEARQRYARFAFGLGLVVWAAFALSLGRPRLGTALVTLYLTWSPWHYTAQNYGLVMMFLHRGGFEVSSSLRRLVRASFVLSFVLVFANIHGAASPGGQDPLHAAEGAYGFAPLGIPDLATKIALGLAGAGFFVVTAAASYRLVRQRGAARLLPVFALFASQAAWFVGPVLVGRLVPALYGPKGPTALAFIWVAIAHSVQYLWISLHYARKSGAVGATGRATLYYFSATVLSGAAIWVFPALVPAPGLFGVLPFESGLGLLVAAAVNVHHFILDGAIWKLRDKHVGEVLVSPGEPPRDLPRAANGGFPRIGRLAFAALGFVAVACWVVAAWEKEMGGRRAVAAGDLGRLELATRRLALVGRDGPRIHVSMGRLLARRGEEEAALGEYRTSLALSPTPAAWVEIGKIHESRRALEAAREAYESAIGLDPGHATALDHLARVWLALGDFQKAVATSYRAALAGPDRPEIRRRYEELLARVTAPPDTVGGEDIVVGADDATEGSQ
jgi:Flp pilus assembly protein TadD